MMGVAVLNEEILKYSFSFFWFGRRILSLLLRVIFRRKFLKINYYARRFHCKFTVKCGSLRLVQW